MQQQPTASPRETARAALGQPLFWVALAVLLLNDHVLKGAGLLPGSITGKLSDFSGLVVAPLVLTVLLGGRRAWAFALVGGWFAAVNLVPQAARLSEAAIGMLGVDWRLWTDPSDLVALAAMPIAWRTLGSAPRARRRSLELTALLVGAFACMATSRNPDPPPGGPVGPPPPPANALNLENQSGTELDVRVRWVEGTLDCDAVEADLGRVLARRVFGAGTTYRMETGSFASMDRADDATRECDAALIQSTTFEERIVFWRPADIGVGVTTVVVRAASLELPSNVTAAYPQEAIPTGFCPEREASEIYGWTGLGLGVELRAELAQIEETIDGCLELTLGAEAPEVMFLCAPPESFRFETGDELVLTESQTDNGGRHLVVLREGPRADGTPQTFGRLDVYNGTSALELGDPTAPIVVQRGRETCGGDRLECGGYRVSGSLETFTDAGPMRVAPGEVLELDAAPGRRVDVYVGRAEEIAFTRPECGVDRGQLGSLIDAALTYWEEI